MPLGIRVKTPKKQWLYVFVTNFQTVNASRLWTEVPTSCHDSDWVVRMIFKDIKTYGDRDIFYVGDEEYVKKNVELVEMKLIHYYEVVKKL
jgi:hypothetical protein